MAACAGADVYPVDVGMKGNNRSGKPSARRDKKRHLQFFQGSLPWRKPRMLAAIRAGVETAKMLGRKGYHIVALGEMGIGEHHHKQRSKLPCSGTPGGAGHRPRSRLDQEGVRQRHRS